MNQLATYLRASSITGTAAEVLTALNTTTVIRTDPTTYSLVGVGKELQKIGVNIAYLVDMRAHIRTLPIGGDTLEGMLLTAGGSAGGVDFTDESVRYQLAANLQHPSITAAQAAIVQGMLDVGITSGPIWQKAGLEEQPSEADVQAALDWVKAIDLRDSITAAVNGEQPLVQIKTLVQSAIGGW